MSNLIHSSEIREKFTSTGRISGYIVDLHHTGLGESKSLTAVDRCALSTKVNHQTAIWDTKWKNELLYKSMDSKEENANMQTNHAQKILRSLEHLLEHSLDSDHIIDWESLKQKDQFKSITSKKLDYISYTENGYPEKLDTIQEKLLPKEDDFFIKIGFFKKLFKQEKNVRSQQKQKFILASNAIEFENKKIRNDNIKRENQFKEQKKKWEEECNQFQIAQVDHNNKIDTLEKLYQEKNANAVIRY